MKYNQVTAKEKSYFSGKMKLADLIDINYDLLNLLPRLGVSLALGANTVEEVCAKSALDVNTFLLICNVYTYDEYIPSRETLEVSRVEDIVKYLHSSHSYYLQSSLVLLEESIADLLGPCSEKQKSVIWKFFKDYKDEIEKHFDYEESQVFPYVNNLLSESASSAFTIDQFAENHGNIDEKLNDLRNIVMRYLPAECDNTKRGQVLYTIYHLEEDLARHSRIEDDILVPMVNRIEENGSK